jgi:hypothetical protein
MKKGYLIVAVLVVVSFIVPYAMFTYQIPTVLGSSQAQAEAAWMYYYQVHSWAMPATLILWAVTGFVGYLIVKSRWGRKKISA